MKKILSFILACLMILPSILMLSSCVSETIVKSKFDLWVDEVFAAEIGDDLSTWNSISEDPSELGYDRPKDLTAEYYTFEPFTTEDIEETYEYYDGLLAELNDFDYNSLTEVQQNTYASLKRYFNQNLELFAPDCTFLWLGINSYISQYGGFVAEFASMVENYKLRTKQDVQDVVDYTKSTSTAFTSYLTYLDLRTEAGFPLSDYTLDEMIAYLDDIVELNEDYYLYDYFDTQVDELSFLTNNEKESFKNAFADALTNQFMPACESLSSGLTERKGEWTDATISYIAKYGQAGKDYYLYELKRQLGLDEIDLEEYKAYITDAMNDSLDAFMGVYQEVMALQTSNASIFNNVVNNLYGEKFLNMTTPEKMMDNLLKEAEKIVKPLSDQPKIEFKYVDESVADIVSYTAYYVLSPFEKMTDTEYVTLNLEKLGDASTIYSTLAHEGYPGHLYQHVYDKEHNASAFSMLMASNGVSEGWAQYVSYKVLLNIAEANPSKYKDYLCRYMAYLELYNYLYSAYIDILVNVDCLSVAEIMVKEAVDEDTALGYLHYIDEMPAEIAPYGYGFQKMIDLHAKAQELSDYSETDFNDYLLSHNISLGIDELEKVTEEYISNHK